VERGGGCEPDARAPRDPGDADGVVVGDQLAQHGRAVVVVGERVALRVAGGEQERDPGRGREVLVVLVPAVFDVVDGHAGAVAAGDGPRELGVDAVGGGVEVPLVVDERGGGGGGRPRRRRHQR